MSADVTEDQRTDIWFEARLGKATASKFKDIMSTVKSGESAGRKNYRAQLVAERLTRTKEETYTSKEMQHGIDYEDAAKLAYWIHSKQEIDDCGFFMHDTLEAGASPDGLIGETGLCEIKCPNTATHIDTLKSQKLPTQYYWQVMGQMWITGREWCDFISYDPRMPANSRLFVLRVYRDNEAIERLEQEITKFLSEVAEDELFVKNFKE